MNKKMGWEILCMILCFTDAPGSVCIYFGAIIGLVIAWLLLQFLILVGCYFVVRERYKRKRDDDSSSMQHKLQDDFNGFDNSRHVHWADEGN
jgi:Na+/melibiose symporter-like transporter